MVYVNEIEEEILERFYEEDGILKYDGEYNVIYDEDSSMLSVETDEKLIYFKIEEGQIYLHTPTPESHKWGEFIVAGFDSKTARNIFYPPTPTSNFLYRLWGFAFDNFEEKVIQYQKNFSVITCDVTKLNDYAKEFGFEMEDLTLTNIDEIRAYIIRHKYNTRILKTLNNVIKKIELEYNKELQLYFKNTDENPLEVEELIERLDKWEQYKPCKKENNEFVVNEYFEDFEWTDMTKKFFKYGKKKTIPTLY